MAECLSAYIHLQHSLRILVCSFTSGSVSVLKRESCLGGLQLAWRPNASCLGECVESRYFSGPPGVLPLDFSKACDTVNLNSRIIHVIVTTGARAITKDNRTPLESMLRSGLINVLDGDAPCIHTAPCTVDPLSDWVLEVLHNAKK